MPTSKHRKNHKQKANARKIAAVNRKRQIDNLNKQLAEEIAKSKFQSVEGPTLTLPSFNNDEENFTLSL
jgi:hypothetical protein